MSFEATKRELGELYSFFRLLADGEVSIGTPLLKKEDIANWKIGLIKREEHDGERFYCIENKDVRMHSEHGELFIPREDFASMSTLLLDTLKSSAGVEPVEVPDTVEGFLNKLAIYDLEAKTDDRTDLSVAFWNPEAPLSGFNIRCRFGAMNPLLDGGRAANLKLEQTGIKLANPEVSKINALPESPNEVAERMMMIERLGGVLKYSDVADRVFRSNLLMIDLHFPRVLAEMVRMMHLDGITRVRDLTERIKEINPLKIKEELISKHGFYEYKIKQFLLALALGMRPAKIYNGVDSAVEGMFLTDADGEILCYHQSKRQIFADFLYQNTRFEKGSVDKDKYGFLERENGVYYFKLNVKIGLVKR